MQTEDIQALAYPVLRHRILTNFTAASEGITSDTVIKKLIEETPSKDKRTDPRRAVQEDFRIVIVSRPSGFALSPRGMNSRSLTQPRSPEDSPVAVKEDDPRRFLHPDTIAKISRLDVRARQVVEGFISGMHKSPLFGHSIEFVQHREYTAGDDIRHLDWKVWSKTDRFYIKQYEAETNLRTTLVVDVSESMHYGRGALNKYNYACTIARLPGLSASSPTRRRRCHHLRFGRAANRAVAQPDHAHRRHLQRYARQQAAREDRHRAHPSPRHRDASRSAA